ncbi:MAG: alpha-hydroxy acid oxidase [Gemmatimonadaceae bacterium]
MQLINLFDYEAAAERRMPPSAWGYLTGGANDEVTLRENRRAWDDVSVLFRTMVDVSERSLASTVLGTPIAAPVLVAPTAMQRLAHADGEKATARAAAAAGTIMIVSTTATTSLEDVRAASPAPQWFQLYVYRDRGVTRELLERVKHVRYQAVVLTVDAPMIGRRERDIRTGFSLPPHLQIANAARAGAGHVPNATAHDSGLELHFRGLHDPAVTHKDIQWIRDICGLPVVVKGVVRVDDAQRAVEAGADAIVVSNHGGRQLDTAVATARVLPRIVDAVGHRAEVYVDGGVRRGTDVLKALAMGARAVLLGRPVLWGLAVGGEQGVHDVLQLLYNELDLAMALAGCRSIAEITPDLIA